ncbi:MAG TPA: M1 family metallopeptidase [Flavipsychrobacter sp.]|mgnify:CR=1 FL=1|nr:M1 family metallopeptidase [Flavipsychrobacter sp.]
MKRIVLPAILLLVTSLSKAQSYWQQHVDTKIDVTLDDKKHTLHGYEEISYLNNSPDTLRYIYIHLYPNAYSHDHTQFAEQQYRNGKTDFYYASPAERGYIDSLQFSIDGNDVDYFYGESTPDIARIDLPRPLPPGRKIIITTPFRVKLPKVFSRLGHNQQAYFISQWFPKPAVYDKKGWHPMAYLDLGEFYSEIGSYDVRITLPKNYVVMATGNLQTESEINWLDSLANAPLKKDSVRKLATTKTVNGQKKKTVTTSNFPESSNDMKTLHFTEDNIHDFAWFADKRWVVRKDTVANPGNREIVTAWSAFLPSHAKQWSKANVHLKNAVQYYGNWVGDYPYKTIKAVQGDMKAGGGMEYPTVTVIDVNAGSEAVIVHEAGHNWFYGILANNERDHAWMDEGINTFYEEKTTKALAKKRADTTQPIKVNRRSISVNLNLTTVIHQLAASGNDQAIAQTSNNFNEINYGMDVYYKTAALLEWLEVYMGEEQFEAGMKDYYTTWKHKHPYPEDFKAIMQKHTEKLIDWFFDEALKTDRLIDFSIKKVKTAETALQVKLKNKTNLKLPAIISAYHQDSVLITATTAPFTGTTIVHLPFASDWTKVGLAPEIFDGRTPNNEYGRHGLFHRSGLAIKPFIGANTSNKQKMFIMPAVGYNMYDGFEAGLLFHNLTWPETKLKYAIAPMYGFRSKSFIGAGSVSYSIYPKNNFKEIFIQVDAKSFSYNETFVNVQQPLFARYFKMAPSLNFIFKEPTKTSPVARSLALKGYVISEEDFDFNLDVRDSLYKPSIGQQENYYGLLRYTHTNNRTFNPFNYAIEAHGGEDFIKLSVEGNLKINYHAKNKALHLRVFGGKYFGFNDAFSSSRYHLNSTFTGVNDYLYDDTYMGRSEREGFGIRQISMREGGLKIPTPLYASPLGRSDNWLAALNLKTDLPLKKLPIRLFVDVATFADAGKLNPSGSKILFDAGFEIYIFDVVNIYVPLVMSKDFSDYRKSISGKTGILDAVTFSINLQRINWLRAPSGVFKLLGY